MGIVAALMSIVLEMIGEKILNDQVSQNDKYYKIILAFAVVAVVEEGTKFLLMKLRTWKNPNFNYSFDGIVYAVSVSLGFAAFENIKYVMNFGLSVALPRAVLAVPGHMGFAVFMGLFYGRAKLFRPRLQGEKGAQSPCLIPLRRVPARLLRLLRHDRHNAFDRYIHSVCGGYVYNSHKPDKARVAQRQKNIKRRR